MLNRIALRRSARPRTAPPEDPWRQVPKIDLLAKRRRQISRAAVARGVLVLFLVLLLYLTYSAYQSWSSTSDEADTLQARVSDAQRDLANEETRAEEVQAQIDALKARVEAAQAPAKILDASRLDWELAFSTLFGIEAPGIVLNSVVTEPSGLITVAGSAVDITAMERYQGELRKRSKVLRIDSINWTRALAEEKGAPPRENIGFNAKIKVVSPAKGEAPAGQGEARGQKAGQ